MDELWRHLGVPAPERVFDSRHRYSLSSEPGEIDGVRLTKFGRFANSLVQVANAIELVERMGWKYVYLRPIDLFDRHEPISLPSGIQIFPHEYNDHANAKLLEGPFFGTTVFGGLFDGFTDADRRRILRATILPHLDLHATRLYPSELAIHIRSGDVFSDHPHPLYPQPPLAFYRKVIRQLSKEGEIDRVCIVYENDENPCVNGLADYLSKENIRYRLQSKSLQDDVSELMGARHAVFGLGTFGRGICYLSDQIESVYTWDATKYQSFAHLRRLWGGRAAADYPVRGQWTASSEQRAQILGYPDDHVAIDKIYEPDRTKTIEFCAPSCRWPASEASLTVFGYQSDTGFALAQRIASAGIPTKLCASAEVLQQEAERTNGSRIVAVFSSLPDTIAIEMAYRPLTDIHADWLEFASLILRINAATPGRVILVNPANDAAYLAETIGTSSAAIGMSFVSGPDVYRLLGDRELHRDQEALAASRKLEQIFPNWKVEIDAEGLARTIESSIVHSVESAGQLNRKCNFLLMRLAKAASKRESLRNSINAARAERRSLQRKIHYLFTNPFRNIRANLDYRVHKSTSKLSLLSDKRRKHLKNSAEKRRNLWTSPK